jgi:hypothetical protein
MGAQTNFANPFQFESWFSLIQLVGNWKVLAVQSLQNVIAVEENDSYSLLEI